MAIAFVSAGPLATANQAAGSVTATFGQATTAGNLLVATIFNQSTPGTSSGWNVAINSSNIGIAYKANCGASEASPTFTGFGGPWYVQLTEWSGVVTSSPVDQTGFDSWGVGGGVLITSAPDVTTTDLAVACWGGSGTKSATLSGPTQSWAPSGGTIINLADTHATKGTSWFGSSAYILNATPFNDNWNYGLWTPSSGSAGGPAVIASFIPVITATSFEGWGVPL